MEAINKLLAKLESRENRGLLLVAAGGAALLAGAAALKWLLQPADGIAYMNDDQLFFKDPIFVPVPNGRKYLVKPVKSSDIPAAAATLAAENHSHPMLVACAAEGTTAQKREAELSRLIAIWMRSAVPSSCGALVLQTEHARAVSVVWTKGKESNNWTVLLNGGLSYLWRYSGWERRGRLPGVGEVTATRRARLTAPFEGAFYYVQIIGALPTAEDAEEQRRAVLLPVLQRADALGIPTFAEAVDQGGRRAFFEGLGFKAVEDFTLFDIKIYHMLRSPQPVPTLAA